MQTNTTPSATQFRDLEQQILALPKGEIPGTNTYALALIDPKNRKSGYPDNQRNYTALKSVPMSLSIVLEPKANFKADFRLCFPSRGAIEGFALERLHDDGQWYFQQLVNPSQSLTDPNRYLRLRLVSSVVGIRSSTLPGGAFELNGTFNAAKLQNAPPAFWTFDYDAALVYSRPQAVRENVGVLEGVVVLHPYESQNDFRVPYQIVADPGQPQFLYPTACSATTGIAVSYDFDVDNSDFTFAAGAVCFRVSSDPSDAQYSPRLANFSNLYQVYRITFQIAMATSAPLGAVQLRVWMNYSDALITETHWTRNLAVQSVAGDFNYTGSIEFFAYQQIHAVDVLSTSGNWLGPVSRATVTIEQVNSDLDGASSELVVVNLNAGTVNQQFVLSGTYNYEYMCGPNLIVDLAPTFLMEANTNDLEKARLVMYMLEQMGFAGVLTTSEYQSLLSALIPEAFERSSLHHLAASGVAGFLGRALKRLAHVGVKYGGPIVRTIRDVRQGQYENTRPLIPGFGPKFEAIISNVTHRAATSSVFLRPLIPGYTVPEAKVEVRTDKIAGHGSPYNVSRDFVVVEITDDVATPRVLTLTISDCVPLTTAHTKIKIHNKGVDTGRVAAIRGFQTLTGVESLDLDLVSNWKEGTDTEVFAAYVRMAELIGVLPVSETVYISTDSSVGIVGLSYAFAFEAAFFGYPPGILYSGDASPIYQWCPANTMEISDMEVKAKAANAYERNLIFKVPYSLDKSGDFVVKFTRLPAVLLGHEFPLVSICESSTSLAYYTASQSQPRTQARPMEKAVERVVHREALAPKPAPQIVVIDTSVKTGPPNYTNEPLYAVSKLISTDGQLNDLAGLRNQLKDMDPRAMSDRREEASDLLRKMAAISADRPQEIDEFLDRIKENTPESFKSKLFPVAEKLFDNYNVSVDTVTVPVAKKKEGIVFVRVMDYLSEEVASEFDISDYAGPRVLARAVTRQRALDTSAQAKKQQPQVMDIPATTKKQPAQYAAKIPTLQAKARAIGSGILGKQATGGKNTGRPELQREEGDVLTFDAFTE